MDGMKWRGNYDIRIRYEPGDVVYYTDNGFTYICVSPSKGIPPFIERSGFELMAGFDIDPVDGGRF